SIDISPSELKEIKTSKIERRELNKFNSPYSLGKRKLAKMSRIKKLTPLFKKEKKENIIPFLTVVFVNNLPFTFLILNSIRPILFNNTI
ncbi:hypothetical protein DWW09_16730, partial [Bacteroides clarus]